MTEWTSGEMGRHGGTPRHSAAHTVSLSVLFRSRPELRRYKAVFVVNDRGVSQFNDEIIVNWAPLVQNVVVIACSAMTSW